MSKNINFNLKAIRPMAVRVTQVIGKHAVFGAIIVVLLAYVIVLLRINELANAEPPDDAQTTALAKTRVPRIDSKATQQIQNLEKTNTQAQSLFDTARNNPFQE